MKISRATTLYRQFPPFFATKILVSEMIRKFLDPKRAGSYAQVGEDRILFHLVSSSKSRFYVDVGCNHPIEKSNTYLLYQMGWRGLCIDANPHLIGLFSRVRPRDICHQACVGTGSGTVEFLLADESALSHVVGARQVHSDSSRGREIELSVTSLSSLLTEHSVPNRFGLLSIDLEGLDEEIIRSIDLNRWRPEVIVIELHGFELLSCASHPVVKHLLEFGYRLDSFSANNAFFVENQSRSN